MVLLAAFVAPLFASMPDVFADELVGQASIIDGNTLARIRLWSVDAPESGPEMMNAPADEAANDLEAFSGHRPIACVELDRDQYGRSVAVCAVAGIDLAEWLVKNGLALDWPKYSQGQ
jgi:endonuclease YncB( thermonuclease family)